MTRRLPTHVCGPIIALVAVAATQGLEREPTLDQVLFRTATYVAHLHWQLSSIIAEETHVQRRVSRRQILVRPNRFSRTCKSALLLVRMPNSEDYVEFRDVFEVDAKPVRDREERVRRLFLQTTPATIAQLDHSARECLRYNIRDIQRNIYTPMLALAFLAPRMQPGVRFRRVTQRTTASRGQRRLSGSRAGCLTVAADAGTITIREMRRPTLIKRNTGGDFAVASELLNAEQPDQRDHRCQRSKSCETALACLAPGCALNVLWQAMRRRL